MNTGIAILSHNSLGAHIGRGSSRQGQGVFDLRMHCILDNIHTSLTCPVFN
jgi:hypothetical protein